jgi:hypothetical protein
MSFEEEKVSKITLYVLETMNHSDVGESAKTHLTNTAPGILPILSTSETVKVEGFEDSKYNKGASKEEFEQLFKGEDE